MDMIEITLVSTMDAQQRLKCGCTFDLLAQQYWVHSACV